MRNNPQLPFTLEMSNELTLQVYPNMISADNHIMRDHTGVVIRYGACYIYNKRARFRVENEPTDDMILNIITDSLMRIKTLCHFISNRISHDHNTTISTTNHMTTMGNNNTVPLNNNTNTLHYYIQHPWLSSGLIEVYHCPTAYMVADIHTKALQEPIYGRLKDHIPGVETPSTL